MPPVFSLYDSIEQLVNYSSKFEISASEERIGTNGAFIDFVTNAFQFTLSNQGWFFISYAPFDPNLSFGFFYKSLINKFWSFGEAYVNFISIRSGFKEVYIKWIQIAPFCSDYDMAGILSTFRKWCTLDTTNPQPYYARAFLWLKAPNIMEFHKSTSLANHHDAEPSTGRNQLALCIQFYQEGRFQVSN